MVACVAALCFTTSCATLFHPERKGNNSAPIETLPLVLDILLLLPGIIPGVVALVIDFGTGAIYTEKKGNAKPFLTTTTSLNAVKPDTARGFSTDRGEGALELQVRVYGDDARVLETRSMTVLPADGAHTGGAPMAWILSDLNPSQWAQPATRIELLTLGGTPLSIPLAAHQGVASL